MENGSKLALSGEWPLENVVDFYDVPISYAKKFEIDGGLIDRYKMLLDMSFKNLIGLDWLAVKYGVTRSSLEKLLISSPVENIAPFHLDFYKDDGRYLIPSKLCSVWIEENIRRIESIYTKREDVQKFLCEKLNCQPIYCAVSIRFKELETQIANGKCIVTGDYINIPGCGSRIKNNLKPCRLVDDVVGYHAIFDGKIDLLQDLDFKSNEEYHYKSYLKSCGIFIHNINHDYNEGLDVLYLKKANNTDKLIDYKNHSDCIIVLTDEKEVTHVVLFGAKSIKEKWNEEYIQSRMPEDFFQAYSEWYNKIKGQ